MGSYTYKLEFDLGRSISSLMGRKKDGEVYTTTYRWADERQCWVLSGSNHVEAKLIKLSKENCCPEIALCSLCIAPIARKISKISKTTTPKDFSPCYFAYGKNTVASGVSLALDMILYQQKHGFKIPPQYKSIWQLDMFMASDLLMLELFELSPKESQKAG